MLTGKDFSYSVPWNLLLIATGSLLFALGTKGAIEPHGLITGGVTGLALLASYAWSLDLAVWFLILNLPLFALGWKVGRRFLLYSLFGMGVVSLCLALLEVDFAIHNQLYAAVAGGVVCGAGGGLVLRSLGSSGGLDVVSVWLSQKYGIGPGKTSFAFNSVLFSTAFFQMEPDLVIASFIQLFVAVSVLEYVLAIFNQRKMVFIISAEHEAIAADIMTHLNRGTTRISAQGAYTKAERPMLMTVINNIQLKRLEEIVFTHDAKAMFIVENTFAVMGLGFGSRKRY